MTSWEGVLDATKTVPTCIQVGSLGAVDGTEDCLYLNVYTPWVRTSRFELLSSNYRTKSWNVTEKQFPYNNEECRILGYKNPFRTSQETHYFSVTESSQLMLCKI
jgi:hypothetical protein